MKKKNQVVSTFLGVISLAACVALPAFGQQYPQYDPQNPPPQQQQQYPQGQQYPPSQQGQQYPQGQYPPPQQQGYPQGQYPPQQYPAGQYGGSPPQLMAPQQLDGLVARIALYPDGLLAQVLTASTYSNEIPDAAGWANQHAYLHGEELARAIQEDQLPWDQSVLALLPFPQVLQTMAQGIGWTQQLGNTVLVQRNDVMDAVQRERQRAYDYGYLRDNQYERVALAGPGDIEIQPVTPGYYYVPNYDPYVVYGRPRPGFFVGSAIRFGPGITVGAAFAPWGWGGVGFGWRTHTLLIDRRPWERTWVNRGAYVHPYAVARPRYDGRPVERHDFRAHEEHREHEERHDHH